jgi:CheY-like chemotaxis protein
MTKILLVEDDKSLREIYGVRLLAEGYDIVSAGDGEEALAMAIKERPNLIVSDVMMPKISGFDMLDILRSTSETKDIKVIMMTALSSEDQRQRGEQLGADRYLVKSQVGIEDVVRTVHDVLGDIPTAAPTAQQTFGTPAPSAVAHPAPQPVPQPIAPQPAPVAPVTTPTPAPAPQPMAPAPAAPATLPQPTAPFSTPRPANLGERVIHPLDESANPITPGNMADLMAQELSGTTMPPAPTPELPPLPQPAAPIAPQPAPVAPVTTPTPAPASQPQPAPTPLPQPTPAPVAPPQPPMPNAS